MLVGQRALAGNGAGDVPEVGRDVLPRAMPTKSGGSARVGVTRSRTSPMIRPGSAASVPPASMRTSPSTTAYPPDCTVWARCADEPAVPDALVRDEHGRTADHTGETHSAHHHAGDHRDDAPGGPPGAGCLRGGHGPAPGAGRRRDGWRRRARRLASGQRSAHLLGNVCSETGGGAPGFWAKGTAAEPVAAPGSGPAPRLPTVMAPSGSCGPMSRRNGGYSSVMSAT